MELIKKVSSSSTSQMNGIEQINGTISILDQTPQNNATITGEVLDIAQEVEAMSMDLVSDAKRKQFN